VLSVVAAGQAVAVVVWAADWVASEGAAQVAPAWAAVVVWEAVASQVAERSTLV
jgi:hypothetical protein